MGSFTIQIPDCPDCCDTPPVGCGTILYGSIFTFIQSGVAPCGCVAQGPDFVELQNVTLPASWTFTFSAGVMAWLAPSAGSADLMMGPDCGSLTLYQSGVFSGFAQCVSVGVNAGKLALQITFDYDNFGTPASITVYEAFFSSPGTSQPNTVVCGGAVVMGDGDGDI